MATNEYLCNLYLKFLNYTNEIISNDILGEDDDRQTPLSDENGDKKSSRSPSPAAASVAESKPDQHERTPSLSPEPESAKQRAVRGDSKHSSRDYEQSRFFEPTNR